MADVMDGNITGRQGWLSSLLEGTPGVLTRSPAEACVLGVTQDSRKVKPGVMFVAVSGNMSDGHDYIHDAIQRGASVVVGMQPDPGLEIPYVQVKDTRLALATLSASFYGWPARQMTMIGVTGTDGKTTTSTLIFEILRAAGLQAGMISTVSAVIGDDSQDTGFHVTTPEAPEVQAYLSRMVAAGMTHVVLEATSHGLAQERVAACDFDLAVVTNITHEHLDYHGSYEAYRAAKGRLFSELSQSLPKPFVAQRGAVLNRDDDSFRYLVSVTGARALTYGLHPQADVQAVDYRLEMDGIHCTVVGSDWYGRSFRIPLQSHLVGLHNLSNCLAAIAAARGILGLPDDAIRQGIASVKGVPGRMERIEMGQDFLAMVDFAHTPNALQRTLETVRRLTPGRVIAVFGSAGLRDRKKRRMMAEISTRLADVTVLTAEDPRTESLEAILADMAAGAIEKGGIEDKTFWRIADRGQAIRFAVRLARPGDLVVTCGKGHEQSMCFGETEYPWDDRIALRAALAEHLGCPGPGMPYLPTQD